MQLLPGKRRRRTAGGTPKIRRRPLIAALSVALASVGAAGEREIDLSELSDSPSLFRAEADGSAEFTWWLPEGAEELVLPISGGIAIAPSATSLMEWLKDGSPWPLLELPALGLRFGEGQAVFIVPSPHYASLVFGERTGIRVSFPEGRQDSAPPEIVGVLDRSGTTGPMGVAAAFREWRRSAVSTGAIPPPRTLAEKVRDLGNVERLFGAPHFYLWGPAKFSRHDVPRNKWIRFAQLLHDAPDGSFGEKLVGGFPADQFLALDELAAAEWPMEYLTIGVAGAIDMAMSDPRLLGFPAGTPGDEVVRQNQAALAEFAGGLTAPRHHGATGFPSPSSILSPALDSTGRCSF